MDEVHIPSQPREFSVINTNRTIETHQQKQGVPSSIFIGVPQNHIQVFWIGLVVIFDLSDLDGRILDDAHWGFGGLGAEEGRTAKLPHFLPLSSFDPATTVAGPDNRISEGVLEVVLLFVPGGLRISVAENRDPKASNSLENLVGISLFVIKPFVTTYSALQDGKQRRAIDDDRQKIGFASVSDLAVKTNTTNHAGCLDRTLPHVQFPLRDNRSKDAVARGCIRASTLHSSFKRRAAPSQSGSNLYGYEAKAAKHVQWGIATRMKLHGSLQFWCMGRDDNSCSFAACLADGAISFEGRTISCPLMPVNASEVWRKRTVCWMFEPKNQDKIGGLGFPIRVIATSM
ncbi:hypothetical protein L218DRAFT_989631, partial [Marasmius fiardii PR-910]